VQSDSQVYLAKDLIVLAQDYSRFGLRHRLWWHLDRLHTLLRDPASSPASKVSITSAHCDGDMS